MSTQIRSNSQDDDLDKVLEKINEIARKSAERDYLYRGEPEHYDKVSSGLYRQYLKFSEKDVASFNFSILQSEILNEARRYTHHSDVFEILTELQHFGGKTNLIDFTTDYLIALFFASDGFFDKDGRVILLHRLDDKDRLIWQPRNLVNRVVAQKSVFVQSNKGFIEPYEKIRIPKELKQPILIHLRKAHGISTETLYNDLHGFIKYQTIHQSAYLEYGRGRARQDSGDLKGAIDHYSRALTLNPEYVEAYNNRGITLSGLGKHAEAIEDFDDATRISPEFAQTYYNRGVAKVAQGKRGEAIADFDAAISVDSGYAEAYYNRGVVKAGLGRRTEAIIDFGAAIGIDSGYAEAYYGRGMVKADLRRILEAIADYDVAISIKPKFVEAILNRGTAKGGLGRHEEAIADFDEAIGLRPEYSQAYYDRGVAKSALGLDEKAIEDYDIAIGISPGYAEAYTNRGVAKSILGRREEAIADFDAAIDINPGIAETYTNRGIAKAALGQFEEAIADFDTAIHIEPDDPLVYYNRAIANLRLRRYEFAITDCDNALRINSGYVEAYSNRGVAKADLGRFEEAIADFSVAIRINPGINLYLSRSRIPGGQPGSGIRRRDRHAHSFRHHADAQHDVWTHIALEPAVGQIVPVRFSVLYRSAGLRPRHAVAGRG